MFVSERASLQVGLADARSMLADLTGAGGLLIASQEAYGTGTGLARSGSPRSAWGMCRLVTVHARDQAADRDSARLALRWEVIGPDGKPFPALDADVTITPDGRHATMLALIGVYRPPPGTPDDGDDRETIRRVAAATIQVFLDRMARMICPPALPGERDGEIASEGGPWPPSDPAP